MIHHCYTIDEPYLYTLRYLEIDVEICTVSYAESSIYLKCSNYIGMMQVPNRNADHHEQHDSPLIPARDGANSLDYQWYILAYCYGLWLVKLTKAQHTSS